MKSNILEIEKIAKLIDPNSEIVYIGYYNHESESDFQKNNVEWLDDVGLNKLGTYIINIKDNYYSKINDDYEYSSMIYNPYYNFNSLSAIYKKLNIKKMSVDLHKAYNDILRRIK